MAVGPRDHWASWGGQWSVCLLKEKKKHPTHTVTVTHNTMCDSQCHTQHRTGVRVFLEQGWWERGSSISRLKPAMISTSLIRHMHVWKDWSCGASLQKDQTLDWKTYCLLFGTNITIKAGLPQVWADVRNMSYRKRSFVKSYVGFTCLVWTVPNREDYGWVTLCKISFVFLNAVSVYNYFWHYISKSNCIMF